MEDFLGGLLVKTSPSSVGGAGSILSQGAKIPYALGMKINILGCSSGQGPHLGLPTGFSQQENWSGLSFPPPGYLPNPGLHGWSAKEKCCKIGS